MGLPILMRNTNATNAKKTSSMISLKIRIGELGDNKPLFPEYGKTIQADLECFGILEGGMESGNASVYFIFRTKDGKTFGCQTSAAIMHNMDAALRGAEERFERKRGNN